MSHEKGRPWAAHPKHITTVAADRTKSTTTLARTAAEGALGIVHDTITLAGGWGWPVLPIRPGTKLPATAHGFNDATTDPDTVLAWWADVPTYNLKFPRDRIRATAEKCRVDF